jgi:FMN reductase
MADAIAAQLNMPFERRTIDLADYAAGLFDFADPAVSALNQAVAGADVLIVASPTYKAAYTGMLKAFLDRYDTNGLAGVVAVPLMTGGSPLHALAPDVTLRPLLVELGASVPTRSLYVMTSQIDQIDEVFAKWIVNNGRALYGAVTARQF